MVRGERGGGGGGLERGFVGGGGGGGGVWRGEGGEWDRMACDGMGWDGMGLCFGGGGLKMERKYHFG